jgi:hypothetical protein
MRLDALFAQPDALPVIPRVMQDFPTRDALSEGMQGLMS